MGSPPDHLKSYIALRDQGMTAKEMDRRAEAEGATQIGRIRLLRQVFGLSLVEAKATCATDEGTLDALARQQALLIEPLTRALEELEHGSDS